MWEPPDGESLYVDVGAFMEGPQYADPDNALRRTGLTMKERQRDEHGMEEVDGLFSSPEKSPAILDEFDHPDDDDSASSEMSIEDGNAPGPMDFLGSSNGARNTFLPPPSRSPAKAPRRSPVLRSSPEAREDLVSSSPSDGRRLSSARGGSRQDPAPLTSRSVNAGAPNKKPNVRHNPKTQLATTEAADFSDGEGDENAESFAQIQDDFGDSLDDGDETVMPPDEEPTETIGQDLNGTADEASPAAEDSPHTKKTQRSKKGPAAKTAKATNTDAKPPGRRGRPPKAQRAADEPSEARPAKKQKTATGESSRAPREPLDPELDRVVENYAQRSGPLKGRSLYILKREDPSSTDTTHTRSGRVSVRPLAYWRNERCVFGDGEAAEGQRYPLSTIKEVIRTEELEPEKQKKGKRGRKGKSKKRKNESSDEEEEDEDADGWEKEGVLHGYVPKWDPVAQASTSEEEVLDIAYAPSGFETREVKGATFRFAKLLSSSFIGSGVVELPPEGIKKPKNSKKMHMVFYVCYGRVQVDISGVQFSAGKGSVFQIPRGNYYSFQNSHNKDARLFFTQGCIPGEGETETPAPSGSAMHESEFEGDSGPSNPPAAKTRGRPKGKQKAK
ncbi:uncharacterized protein N7482_004689 [Penicillium canariense]|uniref:CENP-C homolog n=1 Tax=Penicillium canariense TaxID=189055 RepID=A0A9W9I726_9EURO|nr:uncharacterized protein N7482_004689 [Penicillium canariense]KAJ5169095.1 hypothetical protein N7482_004689 [Penicillium canariense]